jgi:hypothetical protein
MAAAWTSVGLVAVAVLVVGIAMPASAAVQPPAPAPSSDGENSPAAPFPHLFSLVLNLDGQRFPSLAGAWAPGAGAPRFHYCHPFRILISFVNRLV